MKSLGRTIDRILKVAPDLEPKLTPLKSKWKKFPDRSMTYWKELASTLTTDLAEADQEKVREILITKPRTGSRYTFDEVGSHDKVLGAFPEHLADRVKYHDLRSVRMAMLQTKASLTKDRDLFIKLTKGAAQTEIAMKKIWLDIKNHFNLWDKDIKVAIKKQGSLLVLVDDRPSQPPIPAGDNGFMIKVDPDTLKGFFRMLGLEPPPGL